MYLGFACFLLVIQVRQSIQAANSTVQGNTSISSSSDPDGLSSHSTSGISSSFSFLIPYNQTQSCDIYGPLCQTGSITVPVSLGAGTTTTALPCSSYLTAQSSYLSGFQDPGQPGAMFPRWPVDWQRGFGRSPECKSYAQAYRNGEPYTLSGCPADSAPLSAQAGGYHPSQLPAAIFRQRPDQIYECCGDCSLLVAQVRLYYFPETNTGYCSSLNATIPKSNTTIAAIENVPSIAITNGFTFTSPSLYLEVVGTAAVSDQCGGVGGTLTNPYIAIPPGGLSTMSLPKYLYSIGGEYEDPSRNLGVNLGIFKALNIADLECPTFGLGLATGADGTVRTTVGPPYLPIIIPPPQALTLDPDWQKQCTGYQTALEGDPGFSFAIFDPPRALTAAGALIPGDPGGGNSPPDVPAEPTKSTQAAPDPTVQPQQVPTLDGPKPTSTGDPGSGDSNDPPEDPSQPSPPGNQGGEEVGGSDSGNQGSDEADQGAQPEDPSKPSPPVNQGGKEVGGSDSGNQGSDQPDQGTQPEDPSKPSPPVNQGGKEVGGSDSGNQGSDEPDQGAQPGVVPNQGNPGGGGSNQGTQGSDQSDSDKEGGNKANPGNAAPNQADPKVDAPTPNGQDPQSSNGLSGFIIGGLNGGPPQPGNPSDLTAADPATLTVGGQVITANPSNIIVSGSTLTPGSSGITVSGNSLSLGNDGNLVVNGNSISIPYAPLHVSPSVFTVGGETFTALSNGFAVAGSSVVPGGPPVVVSGTPVALGYSGVLRIGASSTLLSNGPAVPTADIYTVGGQPITAKPTGFAVGSTTLSPGGSAVTISGTVISLGPSGALLIGSSSINILPTVSAVAGPVFTVGGLTFTESSSNVLIDGKTLTAGGPAATVAGAQISLASDGRLVVGSLTMNLPTSISNGAVLTAGGLVFTEGSSDLVVAGQTLFPGRLPMTVAGTPVSLGSDGKLIVGSLTTSVPTPIANGAVFTAGGLVFTEGSSDLVVNGETLFLGGSPVTVAGTPVSLRLDGKLIVGSLTTSLPTGMAVFTAGGLVFTEYPSDLVVDGKTLFPGEKGITIQGTPVSLGSDGKLVVGSSTTTTLPAVLSTGGSTPQAFDGGQGRNTAPSLIFLVGSFAMFVFGTQ